MIRISPPTYRNIDVESNAVVYISASLFPLFDIHHCSAKYLQKENSLV